jgi:hypothetical protein
MWETHKLYMSNSKIKGEITELKVLGILLSELRNENYDIYRPIIDIKGIDLIIRKLINEKSYYLELQIKSRSSEAKNPYLFAGLEVEERDNYYFVFYTEINIKDNTEEKMWLVPSTEIKSVGFQNKTGKNKGKYTINNCQKKCNEYEVEMNKLSEKIDEIFEKLSKDSMI